MNKLKCIYNKLYINIIIINRITLINYNNNV